MNGQWFALCVIHQRSASSIDFHIFAMDAAFFIPVDSHHSGISGIITYHRECLIVIIRHNDSSEFTRFCRFIAVHLKNLRIIVKHIDGIFRIFAKLNRNKTILVISISSNRSKTKQFLCQIICLLRKRLSHCIDHFDLPAADVSFRSLQILCQCSQCT